jgi:hypothetical protein
MTRQRLHARTTLVTSHNVGCGVADEDDVYTGIVEDAGHRVIVGGEHAYLLALHLHALQRVGGDALYFVMD